MNELNTLLGTTANLLDGFDPSWMSPDKGNDALFKTTAELFERYPVTPLQKRGEWGFPTVSLHDTAEELLNVLLPYRIKNPSESLETAEISAGGLLTGDKDRRQALETLSGTLGINLDEGAGGFALVRIRRVDGRAFHPTAPDGFLSYVLPTKASKNLQKVASGLKRFDIRKEAFTPDALAAEDARGYLDYFYRNGTHYVTGAVAGDELFQVFRFAPDPWKVIKSTYEKVPGKLAGPSAALFIQFTSPYEPGNYGYTTGYGKLLSLSGCTQLETDLKAGKWTDPVYSGKANIFTPFRMGASISQADLDERYTGTAAIEIHLTSLTVTMEYSRRMIWERVFKGAILQKYPHAVRPDFHVYYPELNWRKLQQSSPSAMLSTLCTPVIDLYTPVADLKELKFAARQVTKKLTLTTQVWTHSSDEPVELPGDDVLVNAQIVALEGKDVAKVTLSDAAFDRFTLYNQHFYGAMVVGNVSGDRHITLSDGLRYEFADVPDNRYRVRITGKINTPEQDAGVKDPGRLADGIQFLYAFSESMSGILDAIDPAGRLLRESFRWVTQLIPETCDRKEWLELRLKSLDLLHTDRNSNLGTFVPVLTEEAYQEEIDKILGYIDVINRKLDGYQRQIEMRKLEEKIVETGKNLNQNILDSGKLLYDYIRANADQQRELSDWYDSIIAGKKKELDSYRRTIDSLWSELNVKRSDFLNLALNYEQAVRDKMKTKAILDAIQFTFTVAKDLFSFGVTIATPASSIGAVKEFGTLVQRIQKFINVTTAIDKLCTDTSKGVRSLTDAQKEFEGVSDLVTSNLSWDELSIRFDEILSQVPREVDVQELRGHLVAAFKLFVLKGKGYAAARSSYNNTAVEIYRQQGQQQLVKNQTGRLDKLKKNLNPATISSLNVSEIDLVGLTGQLCVIQSDMLGMLSKTFLQRDQSLQYTYLQPATPIGEFSLEGIRKALTEQVRRTNDSKTELQKYQSFTTEPIDVCVEIPVSQLLNGGIYSFKIWNDSRDFQLFTDTKIQSVVARIDGIESTGNGTYALRLAYNGRPFFNKGLDGEFHTFNTLERGRSYLYDVAGNRPLFSDHGESWSQGVTMVTPYSVWEISLPAVSNPGLVFRPGLTVTVTLSFTLQTRIKDTLLQGRPGKGRRMHSLLKAAPLPSEETLVRSMAGGSKLNGWDVVFNMLLDNINEVLEKQYHKLLNDTDYGGKIEVYTDRWASTVKGYTIDKYNVDKFKLSYGYPSLKFLTGSEKNAKLLMGIRDGSVQTGERYIGEKTDKNETKLRMIAEVLEIPEENLRVETIEGTEKWVLYNLNKPESVKKGTLESVIELSAVKGLVNDNQNILSVVLDMSKGTFEAKDIGIKIDDATLLSFSDAVKTYFATHPVCFIINSLDVTQITTLPDLKPNQFLFKVLLTRDEHQILQLFIRTAGREVTDADYSHKALNGVDEPIPLGSQVSLMISNELLFKNIIAQSINSWKLEGEKSGSQWISKFTVASVKGNVDLSSLTHSYGGYGTSTQCTYAPKGGSPVTWDLSGMYIQPNGDGTVKLNYSQQKEFWVVETSTTYSMFSQNTSEREFSTNITLSVSGSFPVTVKGSGRNQTVQFDFSGQTFSVTARTSGGGACGCDDLEAEINNQLVKNVPGQLKDKLTVTFTDFSVFVLKNLLFPTENYINLTKASVPSDMLLLGNFTE